MYHIIVNPASKSGRGAKIWSMLEPVLHQKKVAYKVFISREAGQVIRFVQELSSSLLESDPENTVKLIVLGGDGTLNETLQGIGDFSRVQIGYIPTGSSNDMARDLKLPKDPLEVLERILSCREPAFMDLGCLTYNRTSEQYSRLPSAQPAKKRYFAVSSGIDYGDGLLDICAVGNIPKWLILIALPTAFCGQHYRFNGIDRYSASSLCLETSIPLWVHTDGEVTVKSSSITMSCEKGRLQLLL